MGGVFDGEPSHNEAAGDEGPRPVFRFGFGVQGFHD